MTTAERISIRRLCLAGLVLAAATGCAWRGAGPAPTGSPAQVVPSPAGERTAATRYRCDHDLAFAVSAGEDAVTLDMGPHGRETLLRDAGGVTPQQTVYSNERVRAEFGLGPGGNEAVLRFAEPAQVAHCARE